jgi:hypothetical protein
MQSSLPRGAAVPRSAKDIASDIRRYCATHPHARDSLEGIAWWLALQRVEDERIELEHAVDALVQQGVLEARTLADGRVVFACAATCAAPLDAKST